MMNHFVKMNPKLIKFAFFKMKKMLAILAKKAKHQAKKIIKDGKKKSRNNFHLRA